MSISSRRCFAVNRSQRHSHERRNTPAERLAVTLRFLATSILHNLLCERYVDVSII